MMQWYADHIDLIGHAAESIGKGRKAEAGLKSANRVGMNILKRYRSWD